MEYIEDKIRKLPTHLQQEVRDFVQFLLEKRAAKPHSHLRLDWAGGLKEFKTRYTSLDLQKKALEWRGD